MAAKPPFFACFSKKRNVIVRLNLIKEASLLGRDSLVRDGKIKSREIEIE